MRKIRIFVASSIVSFSSERKRLGALFCEWNNRLINKSVFLDVKFCEELDNAVPVKRKQDEYNSYIENSDLFMMLTDSECGNYTLEEFGVAYSGRKSPEILVFCRESAVPLSDSVNQIKNEIEARGRFIFYSDYKNQVESTILAYVESLINKVDAINVIDEKLKKVTFFFGASDVLFEDERNEILRFVLGLNERMLEKGIYIHAAPDDVVDSIDQTVLNKEHKEWIDKSDTAFFLFFSKVDKLLEADFSYAVERFREKTYPKIFTYFYNGKPVDDEDILRLKHYIDYEMNHYYSEFSSVDSIKLSILIQLLDRHIPGFNISVNDGCISDGLQTQSVLEVNGLSIFSENDTLIRLKKSLKIYHNSMM